MIVRQARLYTNSIENKAPSFSHFPYGILFDSCPEHGGILASVRSENVNSLWQDKPIPFSLTYPQIQACGELEGGRGHVFQFQQVVILEFLEPATDGVRGHSRNGLKGLRV
ncbi:unnamed protein product [Timema podura]|uniref:Uncharacterized protein n=1 Tax=Timema podura TaxID=61482 RepID=A0ABN7NML1_TIMPD|nr:unnamed protein product [Timema podura]